ncbi:MAG: hypothetical protein RBR20_03190 [Desulfobacterales bacterium]|jgi:hypothetical protein|nr:hypothetical protein [Desulfobacteraceae bacterium]MDD3991632.1 hypothetical protein [Desulfobacteraceae bacterium]MDY0311107.1 hypothetical protein [Desulfobacterales bacterium]
MDEFSAGEQAARKRAVFEAMSPRRRRRIEKRGYENWDPFQPPKDPIEIRRDVSQRTSGQLVQAFLASQDRENRSEAYEQGVMEMALGLIRGDDRLVAMFEFSCWYQNLLEAEGYRFEVE